MKVEGRMLTLWKPDGHESMRPFQEKEKAKDRDNRENSQYSHFIHLFSHNKVVISLKTHLASLQQFQIGNNTKKYPFQPATPASLDRFRQNFRGLLQKHVPFQLCCFHCIHSFHHRSKTDIKLASTGRLSLFFLDFHTEFSKMIDDSEFHQTLQLLLDIPPMCK